jgi:hypothetical protein
MRKPDISVSRRRGAGIAALLAMLAPTVVSTGPSFAGERDSSRAAATTDFTVSSFNVLGAAHTRHSTKYRTGVHRQHGVVKLLAKYGVSVVGFQELEAVQLNKFLELTAGAYDVYPGAQLRQIDGEQSLAWRTDTWDLVDASTVDIPYFNGNIRHMPVVELQNKATGMNMWFANFHNPATNRRHPGQDKWRMRAIAIEVDLANRLTKTHLPVFIVGDMNEREKVFCPMTGDAPMRAARGGTNKNGVCDAMHPWYVDWIFGSKKVTWTGYVEDKSPLDQRTTDHPVIVGTAHIDPADFPAATSSPPS